MPEKPALTRRPAVGFRTDRDETGRIKDGCAAVFLSLGSTTNFH